MANLESLFGQITEWGGLLPFIRKQSISEKRCLSVTLDLSRLLRALFARLSTIIREHGCEWESFEYSPTPHCPRYNVKGICIQYLGAGEGCDDSMNKIRAVGRRSTIFAKPGWTHWRLHQPTHRIKFDPLLNLPHRHKDVGVGAWRARGKSSKLPNLRGEMLSLIQASKAGLKTKRADRGNKASAVPMGNSC